MEGILLTGGSKPVKFVDLKKEHFPFTIEFVKASGEVVSRIEVTGPGAVDIPPLSKKMGEKLGTRIIKDGKVVADIGADR